MGKVYTALGLTTGVVYAPPARRRKARRLPADITYATNNELGFDYLRDNMRASLKEMMPARTQLCDRGRGRFDPDRRGADPADHLGPEPGPLATLYATIDKVIPEIQDEHFTLDEKTRQVTFTDEGNEFLEQRLSELEILPDGQSLYDPESTTIVHHVITNALRAHKCFTRTRTTLSAAAKLC